MKAPLEELIPLNLLQPGDIALVDEVFGQPDQVHRLHELGLTQGAEVQMIQHGAPCIIRLAGSRLCFRSDDATNVLVRRPMTRAPGR